ncbi:DUF938 domain-containing protein [Prochlorococcus sp. MIT 1223]|uniref:DUF938 domain-containing protein n=1 Tax=Prochlorococcus sp. MIT 1223 TaxID=3096217 RepID=UPI002A74C0E0|nr:DUF938 domain-containing protein [Prochlorococcus sp. MIT 1223]
MLTNNKNKASKEGVDERLFYPATQKNRECIGEELAKLLPKSGSVLEIASGSGEHGVIFQKLFPSINWQASDPDSCCRESISAWIEHEGLQNRMAQPIDLNVRKRPWQLSLKLQSSIKAIVCINMLHISFWDCTKALFEEAQNHLRKGHLLIIYGPFKKDGRHTSHSNRVFDCSLRKQNPYWGGSRFKRSNRIKPQKWICKT